MNKTKVESFLEMMDDQLITERMQDFLYQDFQHFSFDPSPELIDYVVSNYEVLRHFFLQQTQPNSLQVLSKLVASKVIKALTSHNQYYRFTANHQQFLTMLYLTLFQQILLMPQLTTSQLIALVKEHYRKIRLFLSQSNPQVVLTDSHELSAAFCSEYSALFQCDVLQLDILKMQEPILDIGCGEQFHLVQYFRDLGYSIIGIDRLISAQASDTINHDWFEYDYHNQQWGTILSHMAFSNHFRYHHVRNHPIAMDYAHLYRRILQGLKVGGQFIYSPDLPFVEELLNEQEYAIDKYQVIANIYTTNITKLK